MPKSTFFSNVSLRYAAMSPNKGSSGAWGTLAAVKTPAVAAEPMMCDDNCVRREIGLALGVEEEAEERLWGETWRWLSGL